MNGVGMSPADLLAAARSLSRRREPDLSGRWPRAAAILARQALEQGLDDYWKIRKPQIADVRAQHPKLLCLPTYLDSPAARSASHVWVELSHACHHHAYDLPPTTEELDAWFADVELLLTAVLSAVS